MTEQTSEGNLVIEFSWNASSDDLTPVEGLTYALKIGTTENGEEIMSVNSNSNGQRKTAEKGNVEHNLKWKVSLPDGVFYWSVQAIDAAYNGSKFSTPRQFLASQDLKLGDSNGDKSVNILDLTNIIDKILGFDVKVWVQKTSDINNDGVIDVIDISALINLILNNTNSGVANGADPERNLNYISNIPASYKNGDVVNYLIYSDDNKSIMDYTNILLNYVDKNLRDSQISNLKAASAFGLTLNTIYKDESFFDSSDEIVKIYPNPVKDDLNIIGSIDNDLVIVEVFIYNTLGSIIYKESFKSLDRFKKLNLSHLISGTYIIEIKTLI